MACASAVIIKLKTAIKEMDDALQFVCSVEFWRMAVLWTISLLYSYIQLFSQRITRSEAQLLYPSCPPTSSLTRSMPICIVTGATSGLGAAAANTLSRQGFYVVLAGRSSELLSRTVSEIRKWNKDAQLKAFQVDLSSFQSMLKFRDSLQQWLLDSDMHDSVQLLINNAGILATSPRSTFEGYDQMMGTNYIGAFTLTRLLLPFLSNSPIPSRVVNVTSFTHRNVCEMEVDKETVSGRCFLRSKRYPYSRIYEYSKMCLLLFSYELHRQLELMDKSGQVSVIQFEGKKGYSYHHDSERILPFLLSNKLLLDTSLSAITIKIAADPGVVKTNIMREVPSCLSSVAFIILKLIGLLQSPERGVSSIIDAALAPPETSGVFVFGGQGRTINSAALSYNTKLSKQLWTTTSDLFLDMQLAFEGASTSRRNSVH